MEQVQAASASAKLVICIDCTPMAVLCVVLEQHGRYMLYTVSPVVDCSKVDLVDLSEPSFVSVADNNHLSAAIATEVALYIEMCSSCMLTGNSCCDARLRGSNLLLSLCHCIIRGFDLFLYVCDVLFCSRHPLFKQGHLTL